MVTNNTTIEGLFISGHFTGNVSATINVVDINDNTIVYKCNINKFRTPELYESLRNVHNGHVLKMDGCRVKNQATGEWQYIIK